jgi:hypothetical protein
MQYSDNTTFATLSVEQGDNLAAVLDCLRQQQKPVVLLSPFPSPLQPCLPRAMSEFKQVERQLGVPTFLPPKIPAKDL